jgi:CMP-N-acetylneuraminic acid synthetase
MITFKEWCLMKAQTLNNASDMYNKAYNKIMSTVCAGEASTYKEIAESEWAKRYDSFKAENKQLKMLVQKMFSGIDDYWMTTPEGSDICRGS